MKATLTTKNTRTALSETSLTWRTSETLFIMLRFNPLMLRIDYKPFESVGEQPAYSTLNTVSVTTVCAALLVFVLTSNLILNALGL